MADSHEGNNELSHAIKGKEFLDQLSVISFLGKILLQEIKKATTLTVLITEYPHSGANCG
jgi:hypothetical protein